MTDEQWIDLGRRAVACRGWRWLPGMLARNREGYTLRFADEDAGGTYPSTYVLDRDILRHCDGESVWHDDSHDITPDLRDPATLGCLLALVREAWLKCGESLAFPAPYEHDEGWSFEWHSKIDPKTIWSTEAAALVAALEAAR